jgi:hypothetical protein
VNHKECYYEKTSISFNSAFRAALRAARALRCLGADRLLLCQRHGGLPGRYAFLSRRKNMKKKSIFVFVLVLLIGAVAFAQDLALGQKIDMSLFTRTNEKSSDQNLTTFRMISPQKSYFLSVDWDEISVVALPDGTITAIQYSEKGMSENILTARFFAFLYYIPGNTEYTESKDIKSEGSIFFHDS